MKKIFLLMIIMFGGILFAQAQQSTPQPTPQNTPTPAQNIERELRQERENNARFDVLRNGRRNIENRNLKVFTIQNIEPLYREPSKKELKIITPDPSDFQKFAGFLEQSNTGLTKLVEDFGCTENTKILVATEECLKYSMPGAGASFSFRVNNYRMRRLADVTFVNNSFQGLGVLAHSIFVNIGDVPLEKVTLQTNGLKYLADFQPETDFKEAKKIDLSLIDGVEKNGFVYRRSLPALDNTTYILRSIAYKGIFIRSVGGYVYNELDFDKRKDIIVAFRIVNRNKDGIITILWKELNRKDAPKVKQPTKKPDMEIKENKFLAKESKY